MLSKQRLLSESDERASLPSRPFSRTPRRTVAAMSDPRLIQDMSFADYLGDPAPEPSVTAGILRELLSGTPRHVWESTPRLNAHAEPENKATFDLGSATHALFVGRGAALDVIQADNWRTNAAKDAAGHVLSGGAHADPEEGLRSGQGDGRRRQDAVRPARGDRTSPAIDAA